MRYWFYYTVRFLLRVFFRAGFGFEVRGRHHLPAHGGYLLAANHLSYLDPPVIGAACPRPVGFMARENLFKHPLLGAFMRGVHVIALQRGEGDLEAIREAVARLRRGEVVAIFPEGGRQFSGQLGSAKRGVGVIATSARVPIVPVLIRGTFEALPPHDRRLHRAKIRVAFGPSIPYTGSPRSSSTVVSPESLNRPEMVARRHRHQELADEVTRSWRALLVEPWKDV